MTRSLYVTLASLGLCLSVYLLSAEISYVQCCATSEINLRGESHTETPQVGWECCSVVEDLRSTLEALI